MVDGDSADDVLMAVQESTATLQSMSNHLENIETLMRLLCHVRDFFFSFRHLQE